MFLSKYSLCYLKPIASKLDPASQDYVSVYGKWWRNSVPHLSLLSSQLILAESSAKQLLSSGNWGTEPVGMIVDVAAWHESL